MHIPYSTEITPMANLLREYAHQEVMHFWVGLISSKTTVFEIKSKATVFEIKPIPPVAAL